MDINKIKSTWYKCSLIGYEYVLPQTIISRGVTLKV